MAAQAMNYVRFLPIKRNAEDSLLTAPIKENDVAKKRSMGNPFKRGSTWTYIIYVPDPQTGKRKQKWVGGFKTKKEAEKAFAQAKIDLANGSISTWGDLKYEAYVEKYLEWVKPRVKITTYEAYSETLRKHMGPLRDMRVSKIKLRDIEALDAHLKSLGLSLTTIKNIHCRIRIVFNWAVRNEDIVKSPYVSFRGETPPKRASTTPSVDEVRQILEACRHDSIAYTSVLISVSLGLRIGEICGLKYSDFDPETNTVHVERNVVRTHNEDSKIMVQSPKTSSSIRTLSVPAFLMEFVQAHQSARKAEDDDWIIQSKPNVPIAPDTISRRFQRAIKELGIRTRFHDLRHAYATICIENGVPLKDVSVTLGHSTIAITADTYCSPKEVRTTTSAFIETAIGNLISKGISRTGKKSRKTPSE